MLGLIMVVVPLRRHDDQSKHKVERPPEAPQIPQSFEQNIIANSPGSTAQGAALGNVINFDRSPGDGPPDPSATGSGEEQP